MGLRLHFSADAPISINALLFVPKDNTEKMGFSSVSGLKKDDNGVWRGRATEDGRAVDVSVDYQGNVIQAGSQGSTNPSNAAQGRTGR